MQLSRPITPHRGSKERNALCLAKNCVQIKDPHSTDFEQFWAIYERALPACERKRREVVENMVHRPDYRIVAMKDHAQVLAFLVIFVSLREEVALLEYLATSQHSRNQGLGAALFAHAVEIAGTRPLLVEFDSERENAPDLELRKRRKNFYLRQGCKPVENLDYRMPQVGLSKPPVMELAYHWKGSPTPPGPGLIRQWLETIYTEVYQRPRNDPGIDLMMGGLEKVSGEAWPAQRH